MWFKYGLKAQKLLAQRVEQTCVYIVNRSAFNRTDCQIYYFRFCCSLIILTVKSAIFFIAA